MPGPLSVTVSSSSGPCSCAATPRVRGYAARSHGVYRDSGGVAVGSVTSELGGETYAIVGFGRTNVRNYVNLNDDPNDAIGYDRGAFFVRFAHDPHAGFTSATQNRLSVGTRF